MQTRNLTPFLFGAKVTSRVPPQPEMAMIVRGSFSLRRNEPLTPIKSLIEQGSLTADVFTEDDEDWVGGCLYPNDFAEFKPNAEAYLVGSCHPGKRVRECGVRFAVGTWSKSLLVVGKRKWGTLGPSAPEEFETMPLGWDHSFGGPKYEKNPSGKGLGTPDLPNVESPASRVLNSTDRPEPAGFGPLSPFWPQRAGKTGKAMYKNNAPYFLGNVDWSRFNGAPPDQQLKGYLQGDEEFSLQNLLPGAPAFSTRLPALRIRAFAKDKGGALREARMVLDTLLVDTDKSQLVLTWRGHVACKEVDLTDVSTVLIASEKLADTPLSVEHYRALLDEFEADPTGVRADEVIPGGRKALASVQAAAKEHAEHPERSQAEQGLTFLENDDLMTFGVPEEQRAEVLKSVVTAKERLAEQVWREKEAAKVPGRVKPQKTANERAEEAPDLLAQMTAELQKARLHAERPGADPAELEGIAKFERMIEEPRARKVLMGQPRAAEIGPGKDLSGRIMVDRDLSGLDLSGANLEGAILTGARLVGTRFTGANLKDTILVCADLSGANLSGANLTRVLLTQARAPGANFDRATLNQAVAGRANLRGASFVDAKLSMVLMSRADLTEANLSGADMSMVSMGDSLLERANFSGAKLAKCSLMGCKAAGAIFKSAVLNNTSFMKSELRGASFVEASGKQTNCMNADLSGADFRFAVLHAAHFMEAKAVGTSFYGADLKGSEFVRACLDRALFGKANLYGANLDRASLNETNFLDASLYEAKLETARGKGTIFVGANTKKAVMPS